MNVEAHEESEAREPSREEETHRNARRRRSIESKKASKPPIVGASNLPRAIRRKRSVNKVFPQDGVLREGTNEAKPIVAAVKMKELPEGLGSLGAQALTIKAKLHTIDSKEFEVRLDSGANITLMSEEFYDSISGLPQLKEGLRMKLYHLTGNAKVLGYMRTTLFVEATDGSIISFELEAYVVRGMRVPLLIGEDFQTSYEIGLDRRADGRTEVKIGRYSPKLIEASSSRNVDLGFEIRQSFTSQSFVRAKALRRARAKKLPDGKNIPVLAATDLKILPATVHNLKVTAPFGNKKEWIVEKLLIGTESTEILAAPTTWINSSYPYIPIANPGSRPLYIRKGEV
ncbi:hypothetical protein HYPSUDRAFT_140105, partial [Hypholoma sublateritium FD-334 SS-4]